MKKLIHVIDNDGHLRDNITELLEMEGYQVNVINPDDVNQWLGTISGLVLINGLTLRNQTERIISAVKDQTNGIGGSVLVLSEDLNQEAFRNADRLIPMPFSQSEFSESVATYSK